MKLGTLYSVRIDHNYEDIYGTRYVGWTILSLKRKEQMIMAMIHWMQRNNVQRKQGIGTVHRGIYNLLELGIEPIFMDLGQCEKNVEKTTIKTYRELGVLLWNIYPGGENEINSPEGRLARSAAMRKFWQDSEYRVKMSTRDAKCFQLQQEGNTYRNIADCLKITYKQVKGGILRHKQRIK